MQKQHLVIRNGNYYFRLKVPQSLRQYMDKVEIKCKLSDRFETAKNQSKILSAKLTGLFVQAERGIINMAKLHELARQFCAQLLQDDELYHQRYNPDWSLRDFDEASDFYRECLIKRRIDCAQEFIDYAAEYGIQLDVVNNPHHRNMIDDYFAAKIEMLRILKARRSGNLNNGYDERNSDGKRSKILSPSDSRLVLRKGGLEWDELFPKDIFLMPEGEKVSVATQDGGLSREAIISSVQQPSGLSAVQVDGYPMTIRELLDAYLDEKKMNGIEERNITRYRGRLEPLVEIFGEERKAESITRNEIVEINVSVLPKYPKNRKKKYPGKTLKEIWEIVPSPEVIDESSRIHFMEDFHTFFNWAFSAGHIPRNPMAKLIKRHKKRVVAELRPAFTLAELKKIFADIADMPKEPRFILKLYFFRFWVPLFGLYQGMRLNEICQLFLDDILIQSGIPCIRITENHDRRQRVKNQFSNRIIPIHSTLLRLGFLSYYFETLNATERPNNQLFPPLTYREGYQRKMQAFNVRLRGFIDDSRKSFHSFRHNFSTELSNKEPNNFLIQCITGHARGGELGARYSVGRVKEMAETLEKVNYELDVFSVLGRSPLADNVIKQQVSDLAALNLELSE